MKNIKNTDIYLLDQILKGRFLKDFKILDAGCGSCRNMTYFIHNSYDISEIYIAENKIETLQKQHQNISFKVAGLEEMPFYILQKVKTIF